MKKTQLIVHPNSMAARKWGRTTWTSYLADSARVPGAGRVARDEAELRLFRIAAAAARRGDHERASRLRASAMRRRQTSLHCG